MRVRRVIAEKDIPLERAVDFLKENPDTGVICDSKDNEITLEELTNVESIGSESGTGQDNEFAGGRKISESSYSELFETVGYNSESSSERDN